MVFNLSSTVMYILPSLAIYNILSWAVIEFTPLKTDILGPSERLIVLRKIDSWNSKGGGNKKNEQSIVLISSSLGVAAANLADYKKYGEPDPHSPSSMDYAKFRYLDQEIADSSGKKARTVNFSNSAALISEDFLIAKEAVRLQGKPSLIILAIAPRDFLDHYTAAYHRSRLAQILITRQASQIWQIDKSIEENLDTFMCKVWPYYSQRVEYRDLATKIACERLSRSASLYSAIHQQDSEKVAVTEPQKKPDVAAEKAPSLTPLVVRDDVLPEEFMEKFDNDYRGRYLPIDTDRWNREMKSLKSFAKFCHDQKIPLLLIAMPITERNRKLLPQSFLANHMQSVRDVAAESSATLLDLMADQRFLPTDFSDPVHLRSDGSIKLTKIISAEIQKEGLLP